MIAVTVIRAYPRGIAMPQPRGILHECVQDDGLKVSFPSEVQMKFRRVATIACLLSLPLILGAEPDKERTTASGLKIIEVKTQAEPMVAQAGDLIWVHYTGKLQADGKEFDSSYPRNEPISFKLGQHQVITGWDEGIAGMKVGDKRQLIIPPSLAYGAEGRPPRIPPNSILAFDVELVGIYRK
jgi:hypothetical protein